MWITDIVLLTHGLNPFQIPTHVFPWPDSNEMLDFPVPVGYEEESSSVISISFKFEKTLEYLLSGIDVRIILIVVAAIVICWDKFQFLRTKPNFLL